MEIEVTPSITGKVRIEKGNARDGVTQTLEFNNVFLVKGIRDISKRIAEPHTVTNGHGFDSLQLYLGTGTTVPTMYDTGLEARSTTLPGKIYVRSGTGQLSYNSDRIHEPVGEDKIVVASWNMVYRYGEGEAAGVWTELGLGDADYEVAHTRALIKDEAGNPMELTVLQDEFLAVYYTLEIATQKVYDLGVHELNGTQHQVYYFNRRGSFLYTSYSSDTPTTMGWGTGYGGTLTGVRRNDYGTSTFDPVTGSYSLSTSTSYGRNPVMAEFFKELDLDSFGFSWGVQFGPDIQDTEIPFIWTYNGDNGVIFFDPPLVVPENYRIHFNFHTRIKPENYDKTLDPTYDPAFDPELPENQ